MRCHAIAIINTRQHNNTDKLFLVVFMMLSVWHTVEFYGRMISVCVCMCVLNWKRFGNGCGILGYFNTFF